MVNSLPQSERIIINIYDNYGMISFRFVVVEEIIEWTKCLMIDKVFLGENIVTFRWVYVWLDFLTVLFEWKENLSGKFIEKSREETMFY